MKTTGGGSSEEPSKSSLSKVSKKSTKSRAKSTKSSEAGNKSSVLATNVVNPIVSLPATPIHLNVVTTPTTPTSNLGNCNLFDSSFALAGHGHGVAAEATNASNKVSHHKNYAGFDPRSIRIFWEQHDQTDVELSHDVCARLAEDASYKVWELINNLKVYSRHSGGVVTYDLVNEVLKDADVPPMLGAVDSDYDCINYDGSFFYHSDKIFELRDEFQKKIKLSLPRDEDFGCSCPIEDKSTEQLKMFVQSLVTAGIFGGAKARTAAITQAYETPLMGACYRVIVSKLLQLLAFKQHDNLSQRCWRLLRACNYNSNANQISCRSEYFHLAEVLISQLMAPYETIKVAQSQATSAEMETNVEPKREVEPTATEGAEETIYKQEEDAEQQADQKSHQLSNYFATAVADSYVNDLCETIGQLAAQSGYLHGECLFLIKRRLTRFFEGRSVCSERDYKYISRAIRGLLALGEYAFREFIPYIYKINVNDIPDSLWQDLAPAAIFLGGRDDIHLYEWLEFGCGAAKLQPFMVHYATALEKMLAKRYVFARRPAYKIGAHLGVRRLEWSTLAAAMCHGDDPGKALKPKPAMNDIFPDRTLPNLRLNCAGTIRFKFAGCRPVLLKPKGVAAAHFMDSPSTNGGSDIAYSDILIAKRRTLKPLTNIRRVVPIDSYHYLRI
ncbi:Saf6 [Drosophila busckii]|uniref:Saf6 n=1 Tax=Drosophila busckii TaxID=30019 RepID=A0A0M4E703_DROBS|nr:Saf6 [Drosophila busckii]